MVDPKILTAIETAMNAVESGLINRIHLNAGDARKTEITVYRVSQIIRMDIKQEPIIAAPGEKTWGDVERSPNVGIKS